MPVVLFDTDLNSDHIMKLQSFYHLIGHMDFFGNRIQQYKIHFRINNGQWNSGKAATSARIQNFHSNGKRIVFRNREGV